MPPGTEHEHAPAGRYDNRRGLGGGACVSCQFHPEPCRTAVVIDDEVKRVQARLEAGADAEGMKGSEGPDNPITMFYVDEDRLLLTHYCDAGNRPRMVGKISPDGKTVEFEFLDVSGSTARGMMNHMVFTMIDTNHHSEAATWMLPGNKPMVGQFVLTRTK